MTTRPRLENPHVRFGRLLCAALAVAVAACSIDAVPDPPAESAGASGTAHAAGTGGQQATSGAANNGGSPSSLGGAAGPGGGPAGPGGQAGTAGTGGQTAAGGVAGAGGSPGGAGGAQGGAGGGPAIGNPPVPSAGCGKDPMVTNGKKTIKSSNKDRTYIIDIPASYDKNKPYRFFYTSHWISSTSEAVQQQNYYFLKPLAEAANEPAIFVAPQSDDGTWDAPDHALFDDILAYVKANLCIDTSRVFATGFSFGGMITYSLSVNHQGVIRAAVGIAPANFNIYVPPNKSHAPIAWMQTTGMGDTTCPWVQGSSTTNGAKFIAVEHATDNGCTLAEIPTWKQGNHVCYDYAGCKAGYPTKVCTFDGGHTNIDDEGGKNWIPEESWKFFKQF